ncbi:hypothetical protein NUW54_g11017 [Trametes sanguinea]|uniref:Uncharacterized protein n=1 Tax=Trametes sanguinea TaxID=158606 RepID=A0ACC1NMQ5_9APHY|nr:hypothetical protein NUW54_g11017 [Trametes sanguinea]
MPGGGKSQDRSVRKLRRLGLSLWGEGNGDASNPPLEEKVNQAESLFKVEVKAHVEQAGISPTAGAEEILKQGIEAQGPVHVRIMFDENGEVASCDMEHLAVAQAAPTGISSATTLVGSPQPPAPATFATDMAAEGEALASPGARPACRGKQSGLRLRASCVQRASLRTRLVVCFPTPSSARGDLEVVGAMRCSARLEHP